MAEPRRRLYRSRTEKMLGGVAGGLADYFDVDPTIVRLAWALIALMTGGTAILVYLVLWLLVPRQPEA
jgi:phage shock protein C